MPADLISVTGGGLETRVEPNPEGMVLGRAPECDITLPDSEVSRRHARLHRDPLGRWLIRDLGSRNGVYLNSKKVDMHPVTVGDLIQIGPFRLKLMVKATNVVDPRQKTVTATTLIADGEDGEGAPVIADQKPEESFLSHEGIRLMNDIGDELAAVTTSSAIYPCLCRELACFPDTTALVLRVPPGDADLTAPPETLATGSSRPAYDPMDSQGDGTTPQPIPISRRVLRAVRAGRTAVTANSTAPDDSDQMRLTVANPNDPRTVLCATITAEDDVLDLLYVDMPTTAADSGTLGLVNTAARQAHLTAKSLLLSEARAEMKAIDLELERARTIQVKLSPQKVEGVGGIDVAIYYQPASWVGGDYCDVWTAEDGRLVFTVCDVRGHGLGAAMMMSNIQAALRSTMSFCMEPGEVMTRLNEHLLVHTPEEHFATMVLGVLDFTTGEIEYVVAGHEPFIVFNNDGAPRQVETKGNPFLGIFGREYTSDNHALPSGQGLLIFTDGFSETFSPGDEQFGKERVIKALAGNTWESSRQAVDAIVSAVEDFRGDLPQTDDMTALAILRKN